MMFIFFWEEEEEEERQGLLFMGRKKMMVVDRFHGRYSWFPTSLPYFKYGMTKLNWIRNLHLVHVFRFVLIDINYFLFSFLFLKRQNNCNNNNS